ncbi:MAG: hypothetical protein WC679_14080, partial [Bacteroidales bacterium]
MAKRGICDSKTLDKIIPASVYSQVTIFIIIGLLILGFIILLIFYIIPRNDTKSIDIVGINDYMSNCIKERLIEVIYNVGENGGYYDTKALGLPNIATYSKEDGRNLPLKEDIEDEINLGLKNEIAFCNASLINFTNFNTQAGNPEVKSVIEDRRVLLDVNYPLSISNNKSTVLLKEFHYEIPIRLGELYNSAKEMIEKQENKQGI